MPQKIKTNFEKEIHPLKNYLMESIELLNYCEYSKDHWFFISKNKQLSEEFMSINKHLLSWSRISKYQEISDNFIIEFKNLVSWTNISKYQKMSDKLIDLFFCTLSTQVQNNIIKYQTLSLEFLSEKKEYLPWIKVFKYQKLSDQDILALLKTNKKFFCNSMDINIILHIRKYSEQFLLNFIDFKFPTINYKILIQTQDITENILDTIIIFLDSEAIYHGNNIKFKALSQEFLLKWKAYLTANTNYSPYYMKKLLNKKKLTEEYLCENLLSFTISEIFSIIKHQNISENVINKLENVFPWEILGYFPSLIFSHKFLERHKEKLLSINLTEFNKYFTHRPQYTDETCYDRFLKNSDFMFYE